MEVATPSIRRSVSHGAPTSNPKRKPAQAQKTRQSIEKPVSSRAERDGGLQPAMMDKSKEPATAFAANLEADLEAKT